ncbi:FG-GAP-like repeat-containing protein [Zobellia alginiliquefaciens]|uniref:FG-GAP-like repeat-containing protein n=1 Tax=Zobellia alginiliquefaciens TaxID=3032586 RepID=UPI0023E3DBD6|nr:PA14 domain-containing protein [Zobellia alginiliquefaciens]
MKKRELYKLLTVLIFHVATFSFAQTTFTESAASYGLNLGQPKDGGHAWSDFDGDGDLDVLVLEDNDNSNIKSFLMRNNGNNTFTNVQSTLVPGMLGDHAERQAAWGDINNDGRPDFMINSSGNSNARHAIQIFIQNTNGTFGNGAGGTAPITIGRTGATINIPGVNSEGTGFFDFEGDGDLDIFFDNHDMGIEILRNNFINHTNHTVVNPAANALFTHITTGNGSGVTQFGLNQFATDGDYGTAADVNDDGWVDIFMRKRDENDFFLNQGGTFSNGADLGQAQNNNKGGNGLWDLDNDGDLDAVWTENGLTQIHRNDGGGVFTPLGAAVFPGLPQPGNVNNGSSGARIDALAGGDIDNDGDIDIILVGNSRSYLYINQLNSPTPAPGVIGSGAAMNFSLDSQQFNSGRDGEGTTMVDVDDDGDLDIYININNSANQLYINNLPAANRNNHLLIDVTEDRGANGSTGGFLGRVAIGTNVLIRDCSGNIVSGLRQVNGVYGHGTQQPEEVHFGLPLGENETYIIEVHYPNFYDSSSGTGTSRLIATAIAQPSTIAGTNHYTLTTTDAEAIENPNAPVAEDDEVQVAYGNSISVQIQLFTNDSDADGDNFSIESITQPSVGSVVIDDAENGLVTYTYSGANPFPGETTFDYTITDSTDSLCPSLGKSDSATVRIFEPCTDPTGIDTDGDGINDVCDLDNDNDGILDADENSSCREEGVLNYEFYDGDVDGFTVDNIPTTGALATGTVSDFDVNALQNLVDSGDADYYSIRYNGYIKIETPGSYTFYTNSDDGSKLFINDVEVVDNDGGHGARELSGNITLAAGIHRIKVLYFERAGAATLDVSYRGPSIAKQNIPFSTLFTSKSNSSELVKNGDFSEWIFNDSWTASGNNWRTDSERAYYARWNGVGAATFSQTITVTPNIPNTITFDVGSNASFTGESTLDVQINGVSQFLETSTQIATNNGGNAQEGNEALNMAARSFTFTPTTNTVSLSFTGSSSINDHDSIYVDNVKQSKSCEATDTDGDGTADIYDLDSDGDGCFDALEGSGSLDFSDLNGDGSIAGPVDENGIPTAVSGGQTRGSAGDYTVTSGLCDDDGDGVNNANDKCPYFDDAIDSDNDGVPDGCDVDDDNDGVSDCEESIDSVTNEFAWTLNSPSGNLEMDTNYDAKIRDWALSDTETMVLNGSQFNVSGSNIRIESFTSQTKEEAVQNNDYIEVSFTTSAEVSSFELNEIRSGWYLPNQGDSYYSATAYTITGSNAWKTLSTDVLHTDNGSSYASFQHLATAPVYLKANTQYTFRFYVYGQINDSSETYSIFDDVAFGITACRSGNLDGDANPNHLDDDSDGDGCNDADEAYADANADADNNGMYGTGTPTVNSDGSVVAASYATPRDEDSNGSYDFLQAGSAPVITTQPTNTNACPGGSATFNVVDTGGNIYQWQQLISGTWTDLSDTGIHSGTDTNELTISNPALSDHNNRYRVVVSNSSYACENTTSNQARLRVLVPTANAGTDQTICAGESAILTATASGGSGSGYTYQWSTGETTPTITVSPPGNTSGNVNVDYTVTVTDGNGCIDTDVVRVTVEPTPSITVTSSPSCNFRLFQPTTYTLEVTVSGGTVTATEGTVTNPSGNVWRIADVPDGTDVIVTATQGNCSQDLPVSAPNCVCPVVDPPTNDGDKEYCQGDTVPEISASTNGGTRTIDWYDASSGGNLLQSNSLTYQPTAAGTYYAEARNTSTGCVSGTRTAVSVTENTPPLANAGPNQTMCDSDSATLSASATGGSGSGFSYVWSTGETTPTISVSPTGNPNANTTVTYTVTVTDTNGCSDTDAVNVTIYSNPTVTINTVDASCGTDNGSITFNFPDHPNRTGIKFSIDDGANYVNSGDSAGSYTFSNVSSGTYPLWVRWGNNACPISLGDYVINTTPVVTYTAQPTDQTVFAGEDATFTATITNADTYQWQVSLDGVSYTSLVDDSEHSGTQTSTLTVNNVDKQKEGYSYRVLASNSATSCAEVSSNAALLYVKIRTVITNRRITHRVKKN